MRKEKYCPNILGWQPSENDYVLVFMPVDGVWIEVGHDIQKYRNITLAAFIEILGIVVPDWTQFLRIIDEDRGLFIEYRAYDSLRVTIRVCKRV